MKESFSSIRLLVVVSSQAAPGAPTSVQARTAVAGSIMANVARSIAATRARTNVLRLQDELNATTGYAVATAHWGIGASGDAASARPMDIDIAAAVAAGLACRTWLPSGTR